MKEAAIKKTWSKNGEKCGKGGKQKAKGEKKAPRYQSCFRFLTNVRGLFPPPVASEPPCRLEGRDRPRGPNILIQAP